MKFRDKAARFCTKCGAGIHLNDSHCPWCGSRITEVNKPNMAFAFWGFLLPPVGLILYFTHHYRVPRKANSAAKGAFLGIVLLFSALILIMGYNLITNL